MLAFYLIGVAVIVGLLAFAWGQHIGYDDGFTAGQEDMLLTIAAKSHTITRKRERHDDPTS